MPAKTELSSVLDRQLLLQLGGRLKHARLKQGLTATELATRAGVSRVTLSAVEAGEPTPTMGTYLRVMGALGISGDLALLASDALQAPADATPGKAAKHSSALTVSAGDSKHELQDLQSLMLHQEAVRLLQRDPQLIQQALATLEKWRATGDARSRFLWDEWSVILHRRAWRRALSHTRRSRELRQASPLATILPNDARDRILRDVRELKAGVTLGEITPAASKPRGKSK